MFTSRPRRFAGAGVAVLAVCVLGSCAGRQAQPSVRPQPPDPGLAIAARLDAPVSFDFINVPLDDCVAFFINLMRVNIVVDQLALHDREEPKITLKATKISFREALTRVCKQAGLVHTVERNAIFITTRERLAARRPPPAPAPWQRTLMELQTGTTAQQRLFGALEAPVSFAFVYEPLSNVVTPLSRKAGVRLVLDKEAVELCKDARFTGSVRKLKFADALAFVCGYFRLGFTIRDAAIYVSTPEKVAAQNAANVRLYEARSKQRRRAREALRDRRAEKDIALALKKPISFHFIATPLDDVAAFLVNLLEVNIVVDKPALAGHGHLDVMLRLEKTKAEDALFWILTLLHCDYAVRDGAIFISTHEGIRRRDRTTLVHYDAKEWRRTKGAMKKRISAEFSAAPIKDVAAILSANAGVPIRIDLPAPFTRPCDLTLRLDGLKLESWLMHICYAVDLVYTVRDGTVIITTRARLAEMQKGKPDA